MSDSRYEVAEPIQATVWLGGMCGPEGSISHREFYRRRRLTLNVMIQEIDVDVYAESLDEIRELLEMMAPVLHNGIKDALIKEKGDTT